MIDHPLPAKTPIKFDIKDKKIVSALDFEGRVSYSKLARQVGLSKRAVEYRVKNLLDSGLIKGFYTIVNVPKLGYTYCRLLLTFRNIGIKDEKRFLKYLIKHKKVSRVVRLQGTYDLLIGLWLKSVSEFKEFVHELESKFRNYIKKKTESIASEIIHIRRRYLLDSLALEEIHLEETDEKTHLDELNKKIIKILCENGRTPTTEIAKRVHSSPKAVAYRIKKMEKEKIIEAYGPILSPDKIGCSHYKLLINLNKISKEILERVVNYIKSSAIVICIVEDVGIQADLDVEVVVNSNQQLFNFIQDLKIKFPQLIGDYEAIMCVEFLKISYLPF